MKTLSLCFLGFASLLCAPLCAAAATDQWTGNSGPNWNDAGNWTGGNAPPITGDALVFGSSSQTTLNNDFPALKAFGGFSFTGGSAFTLNGNSVVLTGQTNGNFTGIANTSSQTQTIGTMLLALDWGYYTISSSSGGSIGLNGGLTLNLGGVAYFDANCTSTALTLDGTSGLITGLEGAGLMYDSSFTPTGLATTSSGAIVAYSGYTGIASGAIGNGNNINLTASGITGTYTANNNTVNTISVAQVGNSGGTLTTTLTVSGTLTLGANGGVYLLGNTLGNKTCFSLSGGNLTAGSSGPAQIVFAINGNNANNQASVSSTIKNNAGGGAVTVVKTGPGSMNFATTTASSYSGGVYVDQGQLQFGQVQQIGTGPVFVSSNATIYFTGTGTITNDFYLSPGIGSPTAAAVANGGALAFAGSGSEILLGTIHLQGGPVALGNAGDRISGNLSAAQTAFFAGQITGTGTLDFYVNPHAGNFVISNITANANNWQGGMIIEETLAGPSSARNAIVKLGGNNQIPSGPNAGDVTLYSADVSSQHSIVRLDLNGFNASINGLNAQFAPFPVQVVNFGSTNSTLTVGVNNTAASFAGVMSDSGTSKSLSLVKIGSAMQTFSQPLSHSGNTTVSNGTMVLTGSATMTNTPVIKVASPAILDASGIGGLTIGSSQTLNCVGTVVGNTIVNGTITALDAIGAFTNNGNVTFSQGGTFVWSINDATGTPGSDPGWSLLQVSGSLQINANSGSPFNIDISSLTAGDIPGTAAHFNPNVNGSWVLATTSGGVSGFTGSGQFNIVTSAFSNAPASSSQWSVSVVGNNLVLFYTSTPVITTPLANLTNSAGSTATFTVVANGAATPLSFNWFQGANPLSNGGFSASGAPVSINSVGHTSTLTITGVQDADAGGFTVNVTNNIGASGSSSATLTIVDPPSNPNVSQSQPNPPASAGAADSLTASASGTQPFTYQWYFGTNIILGATSSNLTINISSGNAGQYTVVISNQAGSVTNSIVIAPVSQVPDQIVYEPFNYATQPNTQSPANPWTAFGVTNIYNQATGAGLSWTNTGTLGQEWTLGQDMRIEPGLTVSYSNYVANASSVAGDYYPWPGLAGNDSQEIACNSAGTAVNLPLGPGGSISDGSVYFSVIMHVDQGGTISTVNNVFCCGFGTGPANSTTYNASLYFSTPGDDSYIPGIFKTSGGTGTLNPGVNGNWSAKHYHRGEIVFVVGRVTLNPGANNDTCDLWLDPNPSTFYASEANVPTPDVANAAGGAPDVGNVDFFYFKNNNFPASRRFTDLRIGRTWASVTPPSGPTLSLNNVVLQPGVTNAVFASQNAGNAVSSYQWQYNGGSPLSDGPTGHGSVISGSSTATLIIIGATIADAGLYTVTGVNSDPSGPLENGATLTGSASATLSFAAPPLSVVRNPPNVVISWPTNFIGYTLENAFALSPANWTTNSLPPYPVNGTNYSVSVNAASGAKFFRLIH